MFGDEFLNIAPKVQSIKEKVVSWISLKFKTYALQKTLLTKWKDKPETGRKYFQHLSDKDL